MALSLSAAFVVVVIVVVERGREEDPVGDYHKVSIKLQDIESPDYGNYGYGERSTKNVSFYILLLLE